jgi:protoporphyrinogen oxidase
MSKKIAIIGAGFTGLTAAHELLKKGDIQVDIYEAGPSIGGLAAGIEFSGNNIELAYHHLFKTDTDIIDLISELGIDDKLKWYPSSVATIYKRKLYPFSGAIDLIKFPHLSIFNRVRLGLLTLYLQNVKDYTKFAKVTAWEWLKRYGGDQIFSVIWEPLLRGKFHRYAEKISMAWLWARIHTRFSSRKSAGGEVLGYITGGFREIVIALEKSIRDKGANIKLQTKVSEISKLADGKLLIKTGNAELIYDQVLVTVPTHIFAELIKTNAAVTTDYLESLRGIDYLGAVVLIMSTQQSLSKFYWHNITDLDSPFLAFLQHTNLIPKENYDNNHLYYLATYVPHDHQYFTISEEELIELWLTYLKDVFPDFDKTLLKEKNLARLRFAQHVVDTDYLSKIPAYQTPIEDVFLANFSQIYPEDRGTNFAVREGKKIAKIVMGENTIKE